MVINLSGTQPQGPKHSETLENKTIIGTQNKIGLNRGNSSSKPVSPTLGETYLNTETGSVEVYESSGWVMLGLPAVVTNVIATDQGSSRSYNNGQASIAFTPGSPAGISYTATSTPGSYTGTSAISPITVTGLQSNVSYTFNVVANGSSGSSATSLSSTSITSTTIPQAPLIGIVTGSTDGSGTALVPFTPQATGGLSINSYTVTSSPGLITASGSTSPITISGLSNGTSYTFNVVANNGNGSSLPSSSSNSVTPTLPQAPGSIEVLVVAGGGGNNSDIGGGGGAGGVVYAPSFTVSPATTYTVTVGAGGPSNGNGGSASNGSNSSFSYLTANGGGGSAVYGTTAPSGGSGGGGSHRNSNGGSSNQSSGVGYTGYGNAGGNAIFSSTQGSGGGGGAGAAGQSSEIYSPTGRGTGGNGGSGLSTWSEWGIATSSGQNISGTCWYAGGGAGASQYRPGGTPGLGGGGQAYGGNESNQSIGMATSGAANTGGGAGGGPNIQTGGSGIVIVRYPNNFTNAVSLSGEPSSYNSGGYKYYKFTGSGSITF